MFATIARNAAIVAMMLGCFTQSWADDELGIGSKAPNVDIEYWISNNDGLYEEIKEFEPGKIYVIDFWSSQFLPSIRMMPVMALLQEKYADEDVQIISVSDQDIDTVQQFLETRLPGDKEKRSFGDLTNSYCLTADPDRSTHKDYFEAAGQTGIPVSFLIGKTGEIEWIGHPGEIEKALKGVIAGDWDREEAKKENAKRKKLIEDAQKAGMKVAGIIQKVRTMINDDEEDAAIDLLNEAVEDEELELFADKIDFLKMTLLVQRNSERLNRELQDFIKRYEEDPTAVNNMVWTIYERYEAKGDVDEAVLETCLEGSKQAVKGLPDSPALLDTLAHFTYLVEEDLDKAIELQAKAVELGEDREEDLRPFLEELQKEKKTGKKPSAGQPKQTDESDF